MLRRTAATRLASAAALSALAAGALACNALIDAHDPIELAGDAAPPDAAASDAGTPSTTLAGTLAGRTLSVAGAAAFVFDEPTTDGAVVVILSDQPITCDTAYAAGKGATRLDFFVYDFGAGAAPGPGTYEVLGVGGVADGGTFASAFPHLYDAQCNNVIPGADFEASSGTFTITRTSPTVDGSFTMTFADGTATGTFSVPLCPPPDPDASTPPCL